MIRKDDILEFERATLGRELRRLAEAVARVILRRDVPAERDEALAEARAACRAVTGVDPEVLDKLEVSSVALLLGDARKVAAYGDLLRAEAAALDAQAAVAGRGAALRARAAALASCVRPGAPERGH